MILPWSYVTKKGLISHQESGKHDFPVGESTRDFVLREASKAGGIVAAGSRPDRQSNTLFEAIIAVEPGSPGENAIVIMEIEKNK